MKRYTEIELKEQIKESFSIADICRKLGVRPVGGNYKTIHKYIKKYDIDITHFTGQSWNVGLKFKPMKICSLDEILIENSTYTNLLSLKRKLFNSGLKQEICEKCQLSEWQEMKIPLELHHVNGINTDNRIENLQILCNNCHAQTKNFRKGKSAISERREVEYRKFKESLTSNVDGNLEPSLSNKKGAETRHDTSKSKIIKKEIRFCEICGNPLTNKQKNYCSMECYMNGSKGKRPNIFELMDKIKEFKTYNKIGNFYNVSGNAVKKWFSFYGILDMMKE